MTAVFFQFPVDLHKEAPPGELFFSGGMCYTTVCRTGRGR